MEACCVREGHWAATKPTAANEATALLNNEMQWSLPVSFLDFVLGGIRLDAKLIVQLRLLDGHREVGLGDCGVC